jgi:peptide deformylase
MEIVQLGSAVLREKSALVTEFNDELWHLAEDMFEAMLNGNGIGLAAPQVGVLKRLFVACLADGERRVFVNPNILETSVETAVKEEGCLSIRGIFHDVERPARVRVQAQTLDGKAFTMDAEGALARVIQHENDHLNGVLYIDRIDARSREEICEQMAKREERRAQKKAEREAKAEKIAARLAARG